MNYDCSGLVIAGGWNLARSYTGTIEFEMTDVHPDLLRLLLGEISAEQLADLTLPPDPGQEALLARGRKLLEEARAL